MNTLEAKQRLFLYRGPIDDADPRFREALDLARRDPELAQWMREQGKSHDAIQSKFREIKPPHDLAEKIIRQRPIPLRRHWPWVWQMAAAAAVMGGLGLAGVWLNLSRHAMGSEIVVRGEVLDMTCYISRNASGPEHADCARECIRKGLPVGLKGENGKVYLLVGQTQPVNGELADYAAKTVTIIGKATTRHGFAQLQVEEIRKF